MITDACFDDLHTCIIDDLPKPVRVTTAEWAILTALRKARGLPLPAARLVRSYESRHGSSDPSNTIKVQVSRLRSKLARTRWTIRCTRGAGYFLTLRAAGK